MDGLGTARRTSNCRTSTTLTAAIALQASPPHVHTMSSGYGLNGGMSETPVASSRSAAAPPAASSKGASRRREKDLGFSGKLVTDILRRVQAPAAAFRSGRTSSPATSSTPRARMSAGPRSVGRSSRTTLSACITRKRCVNCAEPWSEQTIRSDNWLATLRSGDRIDGVGDVAVANGRCWRRSSLRHARPSLSLSMACPGIRRLSRRIRC